MSFLKFKQKAKNRIWSIVVKNTRNTFLYTFIYRSYWNSIFNVQKREGRSLNYYTAQPNPGAGIGHQMANWIAGYWFSKKFGLVFAHQHFSNQKWEDLLDLGANELKLLDLIKIGYKTVKLPLFDEFNSKEIDLQRKIIDTYRDQKIVFLAEQDQGYKDQYGISEIIRTKFNNSPARFNDVLIYDKNKFNIALHVRRTVIIDSKIIIENDAAKSLRWLPNDYYERVLKLVVENLKLKRPICIYIFSSGNADEFQAFSKFGDIHNCSDMNEYSSFLHLVKADLLITSKSSFSYKPALINNSFKICPRNFWHSYPSDKKWILAENDGSFDISLLNQIT